MRPIEGQTIGQYVVEDRVGGGGMGVVYRARDTKLKRSVALKFLPADQTKDRDAQTRFIHEAQAASALDHPNICTIHDTGETDDGQMYIVMSLYDGETLDKKVARGPLRPQKALQYAAQAARGLAKAHAANITHRDIKPANLMVTDDGIVKILDFGIAKIPDVALTRTNRTIGTVSYMAPEQLRGETAGPSTDIWALGITLYEMLAGVRPFEAEYEAALLYAILNEEPPAISGDDLQIGESIRAVVAKCLEKEPADRYGSANELVSDLEVLMAGGTEVSTVRTVVSTSRQFKPMRLGVAAGILAMLVVAFLATPLKQWLGLGAASTPDHLQLAVLPFENLGLDQSLVDGLVYTVTSKLAQMEQFQSEMSVVPASDVYSQDINDSKSAASLLNVNRVISGSVQRTPGGFRLTVDLIDASTGRVADSRTLDVSSASIADLPRGVISALTGLLRVDLSPESREMLTAGQTSVPAAYDFYTRAIGYLQRYEEESNIDAAVSLFSLAIKEDSSYAMAYAGRGEAFLKKYEATGSTEFVDEAVRDGRQAVALGEDLPAVRNAVGRIYFTQGNYPLAELEFLRAVTTEPNDAETWRALGNVYQRQNRPDKAEESFQKAIDLKPEYWLNHNELGRFYDRQGQHEKAIEPFMQVIALRPTNPWGYNNVGVQYHNLGRLDEALEWYTKATEVNPDARGPIALALGNMANIHYARDNFEVAVDLFARAVEMQPNDEWAWDLLGDSRHWLGDDAGAREAWLRAAELAIADLDVNPMDASMLTFLAHLQSKLGQEAEARKTLRRLQSVDVVEYGDLLAVAKVYEILGDRDSALTYSLQAFENGAQPFIFEASGWLDDLRQDPEYLDLAAQFGAEQK